MTTDVSPGNPAPTPWPEVDAALAAPRAMLEADGYVLVVCDFSGARLRIAIEAGPDVCADCLVPKTMMIGYVQAALHRAGVEPMPDIILIYPADRADEAGWA